MAELRANGGDETIVHLRDISGTQWKSGLAAWLGWFFDGLDMHLYTLVATPFVAQLMMLDVRNDGVGEKSWWIAAVLQSGVNLGVLLATLAGYLILTLAAWPHRTVFLVGILPALIVLWIRRAVPEPAEWQAAKNRAQENAPKFAELFQGSVRRI